MEFILVYSGSWEKSRGKGDMGMGMGREGSHCNTCTTRVEEREIFLYIAVLAFHQWRISLGPLAFIRGQFKPRFISEELVDFSPLFVPPSCYASVSNVAAW